MAKKRKSTPESARLQGKITAYEFEGKNWDTEYDVSFSGFLRVIGIDPREVSDRFKSPLDRVQIRLRLDNAQVVMELRVENYTEPRDLEKAVLQVALDKERSK